MISIVTVNFNGRQVTAELLDSLRRVGFAGEVIVVDNGSELNEAALLQAEYEQIIAIRSERNLGFAGGNNLGIEASSAEIIMMLNNDTTVTDGFDRGIEDFFARHPAAGVVSPKICFEYAPDIIQYAGYTPLSKITLRNREIGFRETDRGQYDTPRRTSYAHGAAMALRRCVIKDVGLMPECYFLYYEELEWCSVIARSGWQIWYDPQVKIYHKESWSTGRESALKAYFQTRNRILFARRNLSGWNRLASLIYQVFVAIPAGVCRNIFTGRMDLARAMIKGLWNSLK